ncbi:uncharacterized protein LOC134737807 isoform X2 [Pongo pygmaeus]|uniref:uncharacterized protein LOC134737807 isoform X2 n=1 Tax=Pongo pygmaeus TaxID=9600 RepID=UPI00300C110A
MASAFAAPPPPLTPAPPTSSPFSRLPPDCAAAIPEGALQAWRAPDPLRVPAPRACQVGAGGGTAWDPKRLGFSVDLRPAAAAGRLKRQVFSGISLIHISHGI